jgi:hypothetical protein
MADYREEDAKKTKVLWEKEEKEKHTALWAGVLFFMLLIVFLWVLNTKSLFEYFNFNKKKKINLDQFSQEFNQTLNEVSAKVGEMKVDSVPADFRPQVPMEK